MDLKRKIATGIATGALLANALMPMAFATESGTNLTISGNGSGSDNLVEVELENETTVNQTNNATFNNSINGDASTGGNDANDNTGGDVEIDTGDADVTATVNNSANQNWASVDCCVSNDVEVKISGNGSDSDNTVKLKAEDDDNKIKIDQYNNAYFNNNVNADAKTGYNDANDNTGGDVEIDTGNASVTVSVSNWANANSARVGDGGNGGSLSLWILDNGSDSRNLIDVELENEVDVDQDNHATFDNDIYADAKTGKNDANDNTGGNVEIDTGDATVDVTVDNMANFNWADLNCGCLLDDLTAKIAGNGSDSDNTIDVELESDQEVDQDNRASFDNDVDADAKTGKNDAEDNTGENGGDPSIDTGDADVTVEAFNDANLNGVGGDEPEWPELNFGGLSISLSFDLGDLLDALGF